MRRLAFFTALLALFNLFGCDALMRLRSIFHPPQEAGAEAGMLLITVNPAEGISIFLDGKRVATQSPCQLKEVSAGAHVVDVRAMGFHSISLPVTIAAGSTTELPIRLRPREVAAPTDEAPPMPRMRKPPAPPAEPVSDPPAPPLPPGVPPIELSFSPQPLTDVFLDGAKAPARRIVIERVYGALQVGAIALRYEIGSSGLLSLTLPSEENVQWSVDAKGRAPGEVFQLHRAAVRVERRTDEGEQAVLIKRH